MRNRFEPEQGGQPLLEVTEPVTAMVVVSAGEWVIARRTQRDQT